MRRCFFTAHTSILQKGHYKQSLHLQRVLNGATEIYAGAAPPGRVKDKSSCNEVLQINWILQSTSPRAHNGNLVNPWTAAPALPWKQNGSAAAAAKSLQSCPTLCDPIDGSPPGSAVPGILQARTLEWVAISFSNAWKWEVKVKSLSCDPMDCSPPGSSVHGIFQARVLTHHKTGQLWPRGQDSNARASV